MARKLNVRNLLGWLILILAGALAATVAYNFKGGAPEEIVESLPRNVDLALKKINYTETRDGKRSWTLAADSVAHSASEQTTRIENIRMTFYDEKMGDVVLTAREGVLRLEEREVSVSGEVEVVSPEGYALYTESLRYIDSERAIKSDEPVRLVGEEMEVAGVGMRLNIDSHRLELLSSVDARLAAGNGAPGEPR